MSLFGLSFILHFSHQSQQDHIPHTQKSESNVQKYNAKFFSKIGRFSFFLSLVLAKHLQTVYGFC